MHVADLSSPQAVFCTSKPIRLERDSRPALQTGLDSFFRSRDRHSLLRAKSLLGREPADAFAYRFIKRPCLHRLTSTLSIGKCGCDRTVD